MARDGSRLSNGRSQDCRSGQPAHHAKAKGHVATQAVAVRFAALFARALYKVGLRPSSSKAMCSRDELYLAVSVAVGTANRNSSTSGMEAAV